MKYSITILFIFTLINGCAHIEYTGQWPPSSSNTSTKVYHSHPPDELIYLVPNKDSYDIDEEIKGIFKNNTSDTLYIFIPHGGGDSPLQKWDGKHWKTINTRREGMYYTQAVRYIPLTSGQSRTLTFPVDRLKEKDIEVEGRYRFLFTITYADHHGSESQRVSSRPFLVQ